MRLGQFFASGLFVATVLIYPVLSLFLIPAVAFMIYSDHKIEATESGKSGEGDIDG